VSDLSRARKRLDAIERSGKRLKAERAELREELAADPLHFTRSQERQVLALDKLIDARRQDWLLAHAALRAEELRLLSEPAAFLRPT
jgi:hypothetical protein